MHQQPNIVMHRIKPLLKHPPKVLGQSCLQGLCAVRLGCATYLQRQRLCPQQQQALDGGSQSRRHGERRQRMPLEQQRRPVGTTHGLCFLTGTLHPAAGLTHVTFAGIYPGRASCHQRYLLRCAAEQSSLQKLMKA